jgi:hypothetical protein
VRQRGWDAFFGDGGGTPWTAPRRIEGPDVFSAVDEAAGMGTNGFAQNTLAMVALLAVAPDQAP